MSSYIFYETAVLLLFVVDVNGKSVKHTWTLFYDSGVGKISMRWVSEYFRQASAVAWDEREMWKVLMVLEVLKTLKQFIEFRISNPQL